MPFGARRSQYSRGTASSYEYLRAYVTPPVGITFNGLNGRYDGTTVDTTYAEPGTQVTISDQGTVAANQSALQAEIDATTTGSKTIILVAGVDYGEITLKYHSGRAGWIYIVSNQRNNAGFPAPAHGTDAYQTRYRAKNTHASLMPKLTTRSTIKAVDCQNSTNKYRLVGLEIRKGIGINTHTLVAIGPADATNAANYPTDFILDRCYVHSNLTEAVTSRTIVRAVRLDAIRGAVVDCWIDQIAGHDGAGQANECQAVWVGLTQGPSKIVNNYLEDGTGDNISPIFRYNMQHRGSFGVKGSGLSEGTNTLNGNAPGYSLAGNVVFNADPGGYPAGFVFDTNTGAMFEDMASRVYRVKPTSSYYRNADGGQSYGANYDAVMAAIAGVED